MSICTPDLCDDYPGLIRVAEPMFKSYGGKEFFGGEIVTIKCFEDNSLVKDQVALAGHGKVLVVDAGGSMRRACLGDQLAEAAVNNGWQGILMYGCIRDVADIKTLNLGVQALGAHPMKTEKKGVGELNVSVRFAGVSFHPGEFVYADQNGVIVSAKSLNPKAA